MSEITRKFAGQGGNEYTVKLHVDWSELLMDDKTISHDIIIHQYPPNLDKPHFEITYTDLHSNRKILSWLLETTKPAFTPTITIVVFSNDNDIAGIHTLPARFRETIIKLLTDPEYRDSCTSKIAHIFDNYGTRISKFDLWMDLSED